MGTLMELSHEELTPRSWLSRYWTLIRSVWYIYSSLYTYIAFVYLFLCFMQHRSHITTSSAASNPVLNAQSEPIYCFEEQMQKCLVLSDWWLFLIHIYLSILFSVMQFNSIIMNISFSLLFCFSIYLKTRTAATSWLILSWGNPI